MNLLPFLTLLWMLSSTAGALQCLHQSSIAMVHHSPTCRFLLHSCATATVQGSTFGRSAVFRSCVRSSFCGVGTRTFSYSFGSFNHSAALRCCNTNHCNTQTVSVPVEKRNSLRCYSCADPACSSVVQCVGAQDRCFSGTAVIGRRPVQVFGCASTSICEAASQPNVPHFLLPLNFTSGPTCCKTSFCNSPFKRMTALMCLHNQDLRRCTSVKQLCATAAIRANASGSSQIMRSCVSSSLCSSSSRIFSYNFGTVNSGAALYCCSTDGCNTRNPTFPVQSFQETNGLQCFTCADSDSSVCNDTLHCVGAQDRCVSGNVMIGTRSKQVYGCASSSVCKAGSDWNFPGLFRVPKKLRCCGTSFCNSAWIVRLSAVPFLLELIILLI